MDPISLAVDTFIKVVVKILEIPKTQLINKQVVFSEIIEPLFTELQPVVDNYFSLFRQAKQFVIESPQADLWNAVGEIRDARETMILSRVYVREWATSIQELYKDKKIVDFAQKVDSFFYRTMLERQSKGKSYAKELVDLLDYVVKRDMDKTELIKFIDDALKNMENSWVSIAQSYAIVRIYCLSAPRLIHKS